MARFRSLPKHSFSFRNLIFTILAFLWTLGLSAGISVFNHIPAISWMCRDGNFSVSIIGVIITNLLPFILVFSMSFHVDYFIFPFAFLKAFCYAFSLCVSYEIWGSGGWLVFHLLSFSSILLTPLWMYILFVKYDNMRFFSFKTYGWLLLIPLVVIILDIVFVSPFTVMLLENL